MKILTKIISCSFLLLFFTNILFSQEAIKSNEEEYYEFLSLIGLVEKPTINYKTLSDNIWILPENTEHLWKENNLGIVRLFWEAKSPASNFFTNGIHQGVKYKIFSPEWYNSYNSAAPYGQNDGALWQGRGYNSSLTGGIKIEGYGFEATFKPQLSFSQNRAFDYTKPIYTGELYEGKAAIYGDYSLGPLDAPQRFGNKAFWNFDFGDSEIRYTWYTFTVGFGTQNIWLGPAQENPIMHSNEAPGYPHLDIGFRNQEIIIKNLDFGSLEFRYWLGKTSESDYFDNNSSNNHNLFTGFALSYNPSFLKGLRVAINRSMISKWDNMNSYTLFTLLIPAMKQKAGYDESDQRASITAEYHIPKGGIDLYMEWGKNDYNSGADNLMRYPFHTQAITAGFKKIIEYPKLPNLYSQLCCEIAYIESSMDYHFFYDWGGTGNDFYSHHVATQGYTNKGQYIGMGIGAGGNAQMVSYKFFYPKGYTGLFVRRVNPDLNYSYFLAPRDSESKGPNDDVKSSIRTLGDIGITSLYYITDDFRISGSFIFSDEHNPLNKNDNGKNSVGTKDSEHRYNFVTQLELKYYF